MNEQPTDTQKLEKQASELLELIRLFMDKADEMKGENVGGWWELLSVIRMDALKIKAFVISEIVLGITPD